MIKHILKIIWSQRKSNSWIFAELLVVMGALWMMMDTLWVDIRTYNSPLGYDITNVWRFKLNTLSPKAPDYVPDSLYNSSKTDDLLKLMEQIRQNPAVEGVCATFYSCPYSHGNSWSNIMPVDGDTLVASQKSFQVRRVSPEYFDVFRVTDVKGVPISASIEGKHNPMVVSQDMEELFYHGASGKGRKVKRVDQNNGELTITAICSPIRDDEYQRSEPCFYEILEGPTMYSSVEQFDPQNAELCVRMKQTMTQKAMNQFLQDMGERLTVNNLNVYGVRAIADFRADRLKYNEDAMNQKLSLMAFLLVNVFFGIIGTFWLRVQSRRGEIGLRTALGSNRFALKKFLYMEGLILLALTIPFELMFAVNMMRMDQIESYRIPLSVGRFLITFGSSYLLMMGMICLGIWFPARKAIKMAPADALHYE